MMTRFAVDLAVGAACAHTIDTLQGVAVRSTPVDAGTNHLGELVAGSSLHLLPHLLKDDGVGLLNRRIERSALGRRLDERKCLGRPAVFDQLPGNTAGIRQPYYLA